MSSGIDHDSLSEIESKIIFEATKALLQLSVLLLIGGAVTAIYKALEKNREEKKLKQKFRIDYLQRVGKAYRAAKGTRRALRAAGLSIKNSCPSGNISQEQITVYKEQMTILDQAQLDLEGLKIGAKCLPELGLKGLHNRLETMEKYIREVLQEYEKESSAMLNGAKNINFGNLKELKAFSGSAKQPGPSGKKVESPFKKRFSKPHEEVVKIISKATIAVSP